MNRCEALIELPRTWARCYRAPADLHHRLTRARGGKILDDAGETYHLMYLCRRHHAVAHDQGSAFENGLLLDGSVVSGPEGPIYTGSDPYLQARYGGGLQVPDVSNVVRGPWAS